VNLSLGNADTIRKQVPFIQVGEELFKFKGSNIAMGKEKAAFVEVSYRS
jgi:hypothetical protein